MSVEIFKDQKAINEATAKFNALIDTANAALVELENEFTIDIDNIDDLVNLVNTYTPHRPQWIKQRIADRTNFDFGGVATNKQRLMELMELPSLDTLNGLLANIDPTALQLGKINASGEVELDQTKVDDLTAKNTLTGTQTDKDNYDAFVNSVEALKAINGIRLKNLIEGLLYHTNRSMQMNDARRVVAVASNASIY